MTDLLPWAPALGPLALLAVGLLPERLADRHVAATRALALGAALLALAIAIATAIATALLGPIQTGLLGAGGIGLALRLDALSAPLFLLVAFLGAVVVRYSLRYLDGDPGQGRFLVRLCRTLAAVLAMLIAGNLLQLALAWVATSLALSGLLLFYPHRPAALLAARKKFLLSRASDACLVAALVLIHAAYGTLDIATIMTAPAAGTAASAAAVLVAVAALLKSAPFPLHGWLLEVMETPTPVSALLHAGIVNAGGFLVLRVATLVAANPAALHLLAILGGFTALFASVVMLTQTSVKGALAYSTIAQMGFMLLECGLGAFPAALLHIAAHALYKAHAFLTSGSVLDVARAAWQPAPDSGAGPGRIGFAMLAAVTAMIGIGGAFGATIATQPGVVALGVIFALGLAQLLASGLAARPFGRVALHVAARAGAVAVVWFALQMAAEWLTAGALPQSIPLQGATDAAIAAGAVLAFAALAVLQHALPRMAGGRLRAALHAHAAAGFYVNTIANRWILRAWPTRAPGAVA